MVLDDDSLVSISANATQVLEGDTGTQTQVSFTISRADGSAASSVDWSVSGLPASDFGGTLPSGSLSFAPGELCRQVADAVQAAATDDELARALRRQRTRQQVRIIWRDLNRQADLVLPA